jgi:ATP/maltotriose-dependent transcriptional regulator MalT
LTAVGGFGLLESVAGAQPLVGRRTELALVTQTLVGGPGPHVMVLVGEAGVGKTRLLTQATRDARAAGVTVLAGNCLPLTDTVPFLPLTEALRALGSADARTQASAVLQRCAPHVRSELARLIPDWGTTATPVEQGPMEGWQRGRLFAALRDLLTALASGGPCALVVEDLHWADATTLDFLSYLAAVDRDGTTRLVLTCREEEIDPRRPVGRWLAELTRQAAVVQLRLERLSRPEVTEQIRGLLDAVAPPAFVDEVFARGGGNAFFTEQLVAASAGDQGGPRPGVGLPAGLAQLLIARAETVGEDGREVLTALAVAGRGLDEALLTATTGLTRPRLGAAVRELADARLIDRPGLDGRYRLRHALVGEAVAADMLAGDRRERHAVMARALVANAAADGAGEVAEHWAAAGEVSQEMPWRLAAAAQAEQVYAHREAATHWERVIDLWPRLPVRARPAGFELASAYLNALGALERCGDTKSAGRLAEEAVRSPAATADRRTLALLYERVGSFRWVEQQDDAGLAALEFAMELLADLPVSKEHAVVLLTYGQAMWEMDRGEDARRYLNRAMEACQSQLPATEDVATLCLLAWLTFDSGDITTGMHQLDQIVALIGRDADHPAATRVAAERSQTLLILGRLDDAAAAARSGLEMARRAGLEQTAAAQYLCSILFDALAELGRYSEAEAVIRAATRWPPTSGASYDHMARARLDMLAGDLAAATNRWAAIEAVTHAGNLSYGGNLVNRGVIDLWARRPMEALRRIQQVPDRLDAAWYRRFTAAILSTALRACADIAEAARARRDSAGEQAARQSAQDLVDAHEAMERDPFAPHPFYVTAAAHGAIWAAELTRVAGKSDPDAWAAAAAAWTSLHRPHRTAYARWRQAEALLTAGRGPEARECLREAAAAVHNHAPLLAEIRSLARLARLDLADQHTEPDATTPQPAPYGLTPRETAVLRLVAEGLTNTQIGNRLFISNKTASVHVTHILSKLGVKNRPQAAALAQRAGLLGPDRC